MSTGLKVEQYLNSTWVDVSSDVFYEDEVVINRGRRDETADTSAAACLYTLQNTNDNWSPKNVLGTYWPNFGRGVPTRVSVNGAKYLASDGNAGEAALCPDTAGLSITGDIDIRFDAWLAEWRGKDAKLCGKYAVTGNQRSWRLMVNAAGTLKFSWSSLGTLASVIHATSTAYIPTPTSGRKAVRVTLDVNNGAAGNTVTFYTSDSITGTWTQLGDPVVTAGTTSIFDSTANVFIGNSADDTFTDQEVRMHVYGFKILNGIAGTEKANPDFTAQTVGATSFADAAGNTWSVFGSITNRSYRHWGEISSVVNQEDSKGTDKRAKVESGSLLRRLGASTGVAKSTMTQTLSNADATVAYWPMEDGVNATQVSSGISNGEPMLVYGTPTYAAGSTIDFPGSAPIMEIKSASLQGIVQSYTSTDQWQIRFLLSIPAAGTVDGAVLLRVYTTGTAARWDVTYSTASSGKVVLTCYSADGTLLATSLGTITGCNGFPAWWGIECRKNGTGVDYTLDTLVVGQTSAIGEAGTVASTTVGIPRLVQVNKTGAALDEVYMGQLAVQNQIDAIFSALSGELIAYLGESAIDRVIRLAAQQGLSAQIIGGPEYSGFMGYQTIKTYLELYRECEATDLGILLEDRESLALLYRSEETLYNQDPIVTFSYTQFNLSTIEPIEDDSTIRNDVTVHRTGGGQARQTLASGTLSTLDPPSGVGRYDYDKTISTPEDTFLSAYAGWVLNLGTATDPRWTITIQLERAPYVASSTLLQQVLSVDVGDKIQINNIPIRRSNRNGEAIVQQISEVIDQFQHKITFICAPERPWHVGEYSTDRRYSPSTYGAATLTSSLTSSATSFSVTSVGSIWTTTDLPLDIEIDGEQITVGTITGSSSPQTFGSCTRAVNGVTKAHSASAIVELWDPARWAL